MSRRPGEFPVNELISWLATAQLRWGAGGETVTAHRDGDGLAIYQDGLYRATLTLEERPTLIDWADDDA